MKLILLACILLVEVGAIRLGNRKNEVELLDPSNQLDSVVRVEKDLRKLQNDDDGNFDDDGNVDDGLFDDDGNYDDGYYDDDGGVQENTSGGGFRLRLYWEEGYYWQETSREFWFCMECEGGYCEDGYTMEVQYCGSSNTRLELYDRSGDEANLKDADSNMCMRSEGGWIIMRECDSSDSRQRFTGYFSDPEFEIHPRDDSSLCITQEHHPKPGESLKLTPCSIPRGDDTSYWNYY